MTILDKTVSKGLCFSNIELNKSQRRYIKKQEKYLERNCTKVWLQENRLGEVFIFGKFCKGAMDTIVVTIASYHPDIGFITADFGK